MKLKCIYSEDPGNHPTFIVGKEYKVCDREGDRYYVITENGTYIDIVLNGAIWKFKLIEDVEKEKEDILFEIESLINQLNNEFNKLKKLI